MYVLAGMNLFGLRLYPLIPLEAVTIADKSLAFFIEPLHLGQVFEVDIDNYFGLDGIKRFYKTQIFYMAVKGLQRE